MFINIYVREADVLLVGLLVEIFISSHGGCYSLSRGRRVNYRNSGGRGRGGAL